MLNSKQHIQKYIYSYDNTLKFKKEEVSIILNAKISETFRNA